MNNGLNSKQNKMLKQIVNNDFYTYKSIYILTVNLTIYNLALVICILITVKLESTYNNKNECRISCIPYRYIIITAA